MFNVTWPHGRHADEEAIEEISRILENKLQPYKGQHEEEQLFWLQEQAGVHIYAGEGVALALELSYRDKGPAPDSICVDFATIESNGWWRGSDGLLHYTGSGDEA